MKKKIIILVGVVLVIMLGVLGYLYINKNKDTDGKKFAEEYGSVTEDNVFVYKSIDEIINIERLSGVMIGAKSSNIKEAQKIFKNI